MSKEEPIASMGRGMVILAWLMALGLLTLIFGHWEDQQVNPNQNPDSTITNNKREVILQANRYHHYIASGTINGIPVQFILDTGASDVAVPGELARRLKLKQGNPGYAHTANGTAQVFSTQIDTLGLGAIELNNVQASIIPSMNGEGVLLGMSALKHIEFSQSGSSLTLRQYYQ